MSNEIVIINAPSQEIVVYNTPEATQEVEVGNGAVSSVNGQAGVVNLTQDNIPDGETYVQYSKTEKEKLADIDESLVGVTADELLSDKLNRTELDDAINSALKTAKESGEFDGADGKDGFTPYILNGYWYIGETNTGVRAEGINGKDGTDGVFIGTMKAYEEASSAGLIAKGTIVIIEEEETSTTAVLGKAILGKMILGKV